MQRIECVEGEHVELRPWPKAKMVGIAVDTGCSLGFLGVLLTHDQVDELIAALQEAKHAKD